MSTTVDFNKWMAEARDAGNKAVANADGRLD